MRMSIGWVEDNLTEENSVTVFTDSQSLCVALLGSSTALDELRLRISRVRARLVIQWIPGHSNIPGNELADSAAKAATLAPGRGGGVTYTSICSAIKAAVKDPPIQHLRTKEVYAAYSRERESGVHNRSDQSLLAKLRSGHWTGLRAYRARVDRVSDPNCHLCGEGVPQTLEHWFQECPATEQRRRDLFGDEMRDLGCLSRYPMKAIALARGSLLGAGK